MLNNLKALLLYAQDDQSTDIIEEARQTEKLALSEISCPRARLS
jgi:hypothetical protein